jgi:hypothetical protein
MEVMMKKLMVLMVMICLPVITSASERTLTLDQQIALVKEYLKTIQHPRLILGVGNADELNGIKGANPFLDNVNDILVNEKQKPGILVNRTLTVNFNDLAQLNKLADAFAGAFDVITADFFVTKYANWSKEHLDAFKRMLKPGGLFFMPIDAEERGITILANTVEDLFKQASTQEKLQESMFLVFSRAWRVTNLPLHLDIPIDSQTQQEITQTIEKYKEVLPIVNEWISKNSPTGKPFFPSGAVVAPLRTEFSNRGLNPKLADDFVSMDMSKDDQRLANYIRNQIMAPKKAVVQKELSDKFMEEYVIPLNLKRILGAVFNPQHIIIKKNLELPQPHRQPTLEYYSISATK